MATITPEFLTLHRYFLWANRMRLLHIRFLKTHGPPPEDALGRFSWYDLNFTYSSFWFASLYVVVEGYKELNLHHPKVDALLTLDHVNLLRRYRNGVFHFQRDYHDRRFAEFVAEGETIATWIDELGAFFLGMVKETGFELISEPVTDEPTKRRIRFEHEPSGGVLYAEVEEPPLEEENPGQQQ